MSSQQKSGSGCWAKGCIFLLIGLFVAGVILFFAGVSFVKKVKQELTTTTPPPPPPASLTPEGSAKLMQSIENFQQSLQQNGEARLELSASEVNSLISSNPQFEQFKDKLQFNMKDDLILIQTNLPLSGLPGFGGQSMNANLGFHLGVQNGKVSLDLKSVTMGNTQLPDSMLQSFGQGFKESLQDQVNGNDRLTAILGNIKNLEVKNSKMIVVVKTSNLDSLPIGSDRTPSPSFPEVPAIPIETPQPQNTAPHPSPPPSASSQAQTLSTPSKMTQGFIGMTLDQVRENLGQPLMTSEESEKIVLHYPKIQITSVNGIVTEEKLITR